MKLFTASHLHAETVLTGEYRDAFAQLRDVLIRAPVPLRDAEPFTSIGRPPRPKRQRRRLRGEERWMMLPIDQIALNDYFAAALRVLGWHHQPPVLKQPLGGEMDSHLKGDFEKQGVFVEVEFGNTASLFRDLFKFQVAGRSGVGAVGVLIVATAQMATFFDSGVASYEQAVKLLPAMNIGLALPTLIVGLAIDDWEPIRSRYERMKTVVEAHGLRCHDFDQVLRLAE